MISHIEMARRLRKESAQWKKSEMKTDYVLGLLAGLSIAIRITHEIKSGGSHEDQPEVCRPHPQEKAGEEKRPVEK